MFARVGGTRGHGRVIATLMRHLGNHLDGSPCQVFSDNMKVQVGQDTVPYPDGFVTCEPEFTPEQPIFTAPVLIIEVLSPSTQACDRSRKFALYRQLASLREYGLIDPQTLRVEVFRPGDDGLWNLLDLSDGPALELASVDARIALADLLKGMESRSPGPR